MGLKTKIRIILENQRYKLIYAKRHSQKILFLHIAKTAGTSFRLGLQMEYGPLFVYPGSYYLSKLPRGEYVSGSKIIKNINKLPAHNVLIGHFTAAIATRLPNTYRTAVFVRDPIQRSLSLLAHFHRSTGIKISKLIDSGNLIASQIADFQTRVLGSEDILEPEKVPIPDDLMLRRAVDFIQNCDFIGITERYLDSCKIFDGLFQTNISQYNNRENVLRPNGGELSEYISTLKPLLENDLILYQSALDRFEKQNTSFDYGL
jgi:hypothetical protein